MYDNGYQIQNLYEIHFLKFAVMTNPYFLYQALQPHKKSL